VELLTSPAQVAAAESRTDDVAAMKAAKALAQIQQVEGVSIEGHPHSEYDGVYTFDSTDDSGWPVLKSGRGNYCFYNKDKEQWRILDRVESDADTCTAYIKAETGLLPIGTHTWSSYMVVGPSPN
jgi:hypothetical protein